MIELLLTTLPDRKSTGGPPAVENGHEIDTNIEESVSQYFALPQQEAADHVKDLEGALEQVRQLEQQRGAVWQQAAHDLRGKLSVVANVVGLTRHRRNKASRNDFVRILMRNVTSLHHCSTPKTTTPGEREGASVLGNPSVGGTETLSLRGKRPAHGIEFWHRT